MMKKNLYILVLFFSVILCHAQKPTTSLSGWKAKLSIAKDDTTKMRCYAEISMLQIRADSIKFYVRKGLNISKKYPNHVVNSMLYNDLGRAFQVEAKLDSGIYFLKKAYDAAVKSKDDKQIKYADFNLIILSTSPAEQVSRLLKMLKKYTYQPSKNEYDKILLGGIYMAISSRYLNLENIQKSKLYLQKSQGYISSYTDSLRYYSKYSDLLNTETIWLIEINDTLAAKKVLTSYKSLIKVVKKVVANRNDAQSKQCMAVLYGNYSDILTKAKKYQESIYYLNLATGNLDDIPEYLLYAKYSSMGAIYVGQGKYKEGIAYLKKAQLFFKKFGAYGSENDVLQQISEAYTLLKDYKLAHYYSKEALILQKKYLNSKQQQLSLEVEKQFELAEKQEQITTQELESKLKEERIKIEQRQKNIFIALLIVSLVLLAWTIWSYQKQKRLRILLENQTKELTDANQTKDKVFRVLAHDLQSPVSDLKIIMMLFQTKDITTEEVKELITPLNSKIESLQSILNNLLQWALLELKSNSQKHEIISLQQIIENVILQSKSNAEKKAINISHHSLNFNIEANANEIEIAIRNLLANAIKFTPINGEIYIEGSDNNQQIEIKIKDTGIGISPEIPLNQYPPVKMGTIGEKGLGLGLKITNDLIRKNGGKLTFESLHQNGTIVSLIFNKVFVGN